jgi:hypothetical protein
MSFGAAGTLSFWIPIPIPITKPKKENHNKPMRWTLILRASDPQGYQDPIGEPLPVRIGIEIVL